METILTSVVRILTWQNRIDQRLAALLRSVEIQSRKLDQVLEQLAELKAVTDQILTDLETDQSTGEVTGFRMAFKPGA